MVSGCDGPLHDEIIKKTGANIIGYWPVEGYTFEASKALTEDGTQFVGLALDEDFNTNSKG